MGVTGGPYNCSHRSCTSCVSRHHSGCVGYWIGSSSTVILWRFLEPLMVTIFHAKQVTAYDALHGALLGMWDGPTEGDAFRWLMQRGPDVAGSAAWT